MQTARDRYLLAAEEMARGRPRVALPLLKEATAQDPQNFWAWFLLGLCHDSLAQNADAAACYSTCIALWPKLPWPHYNRGLTHLRQVDYLQARADFDQAILLRPEDAEMRHPAGPGGARAETVSASASGPWCRARTGGGTARVFLMRAGARRRAGDAEGALRDREAGLQQKPTNARGWLRAVMLA